MDEMTLATRGGVWERLFNTNIAAAAASFVSGGLVEQLLNAPFSSSGDQAFRTLSAVGLPVANNVQFTAGEAMPNAVEFMMFGTDTSNQTFSARIYGITQGVSTVGSGTTKTVTWIPTLLGQVLCTLGAATGVAGGLIEAADLYCDTYALAYGAAGDFSASNNTDLRGATFRLDLRGFPILGVELDDGGSAATVNGLFRWLW